MGEAVRFLLVDKGQSPDFEKGDRAGITGYFLDIRSATQHDLLEIRKRQHIPGVYANPVWDDAPDAPDALVAWAVKLFRGFGVSNLRLQWDIEVHDADYISDVLWASRHALPQVGTSWTLEPQQGGWFTTQLLEAIRGTRTRAVVQLYNGAMTTHYDSWGQVARMIDKGIPAAQVSPFYDAAALPAGWNGYAFTQGRLP